MGILSSAVSITRYRVEGKIEGPVIDIVSKGLKKNAIPEIDEEAESKAAGWTSFENPFHPNFDGSRSSSAICLCLHYGSTANRFRQNY